MASALERQRELVRLLDVRDAAADDPKALINEIRFFDPTTEKWVEFNMFPPEGWESPASFTESGDLVFSKQGTDDWYWQSEIIDWWHDSERRKYLILKARQLGITLLACAYALWLMLYRPGSVSVAYSYTEDEAVKLVQAAWMMYESLPAVLKEHVEVITPTPGRAVMPSEFIRIRHKDSGLVSVFQALPATKKHGHGSRVSFAIMDEVARQDYAREIYTAINPAISRGGKLAMISTANGVSNKETGEGNFFHHLYHTKVEKGLEFCFLPWNLEPTRDERWYQVEAMALPDAERNQQYPLNENDAFTLSGDLFFDRDALDWYSSEVRPPIQRGTFVVQGKREAKFMRLKEGVIEVYELPKPTASYAIGVDVASGKASDYTSADVIDLTTGAIVASFHAKMEAPRAAVQLHYLGKWYAGREGMALIAVERQGGYGDALIIALRDGNENLPAYSRLYRHKKFVSGKRPMAEEYGHPMSEQARGHVLDQLRSWIRQRLFPWLSSGHVDELGSFVYAETKPSPRAMDGTNDDRVMSLALAVEMHRQYGVSPAKKQSFKKREYQPSPVRTYTS